jgi:hypothetical protein
MPRMTLAGQTAADGRAGSPGVLSRGCQLARLPEVSVAAGIDADGMLAFAQAYERQTSRFMPTPRVASLGRNEAW